MKRHTVKELAQLAKVSVRTLHFYDEINLLKPATIGENGYRYYGRDELLRLQQILFYRELGMALEKIREILDATDFDRIKALDQHRKDIARERERLTTLIRTIDQTVANYKGEIQMKDEDLYVGFSPEKQAEYEAFLVERYGDAAAANIDSSKLKMKSWPKEETQKIGQAFNSIHLDLKKLIEKGARPVDPEVQQVIEQHYKLVSRFWKPDRESYPGLGLLYIEHEDFRIMYEGYHPKLAEFLAEAMTAYAERQL
jgi:DNA-binding transcriptional MerR regulator